MKRIAVVVSLALVTLGLAPGVQAGTRARYDVRASIARVRLFDRAVITGRVTPAEAGGRVTVKLWRGGEAVNRSLPRMDSEGRFRATFDINHPGWYRASASYNGDAMSRGEARTEAKQTPLPFLERGDENVFVRLLEQRLAELRYRILGIGGPYTKHTADAVVAFHKVQGMERVFTVSPKTWWALAKPYQPEPRFVWPDFHVEIDQSLQVLYTVRGGEVATISHVSTGKPSTPTYDGKFHVYRKVKGVYNSLYWPSYFDGGRAIHGWESVPTYNASHGCIRFPFWNAIWIHHQTPIGTVIRIYHS